MMPYVLPSDSFSPPPWNFFTPADRPGETELADADGMRVMIYRDSEVSFRPERHWGPNARLHAASPEVGVALRWVYSHLVSETVVSERELRNWIHFAGGALRKGGLIHC